MYSQLFLEEATVLLTSDIAMASYNTAPFQLILNGAVRVTFTGCVCHTP